MNQPGQTVVGVDVGGERKGFHAVSLSDNSFEVTQSLNPCDIAEWCVRRQARTIAVDAPCGWSSESRSRLCERELAIEEVKINCFATPTRDRASAHTKGFYGWVFNGEKLYAALRKAGFPLFCDELRSDRRCIETFPHAVFCALMGRVTAVKHKKRQRSDLLHKLGYDTAPLRNVDYVDAALCALAARSFQDEQVLKFGDYREGVIMLPMPKLAV
jgi:predicted nuclease with RNAse H fold